MNTKVEEALDVVRNGHWSYGKIERASEAIRTIADYLAQQDATIARMREALRLFTGSAYPVEESINPRGYNWSESYLDAALVFAAALKDSP